MLQVRRRRQALQDEQRQAGQNALQNLLPQRDLLSNDTNQSANMSMPPLENLVRAIGGGDRQQGGPGIIGQLIRSPVMENLVQQVMQGVGDVDVGDGARRGPATGGLDFSGMLQHMMPVVTQMLGGGSGCPLVRHILSADATRRAFGRVTHTVGACRVSADSRVRRGRRAG